VYFPRRVIPMLPEKLSNGLCSLNPEVDRLVLVCDCVISAKGSVDAYQFYPAVIHSHARLTYNEVWEALSVPGSRATERLAAVLPQLTHLHGLYETLVAARGTRGAIEFETTETYIVCDPNGRIDKIVPRVRNDAHRLIEECMLAANTCAADFLARNQQATLYRVHEGPTPERLETLRTMLKSLGLALEGGDEPEPADYSRLLKQIQARPDAQLLQTVLLRSMQQAVYSPHNAGHFGLAYSAYTHYTSPIRRYPDLLVHRAIKGVLAGKPYEPQLLVTPVAALASRGARALNRAAAVTPTPAKSGGKGAKEVASIPVWEKLGLLCSSNERRADEASRDVEAWLKSYFMRSRVGESFSGTVSSVVPFGIFVVLDDLFVEGLVHVSELGSEYFLFNEALHEMRGERTGLRYRLGDRVNVQVARVDLEARRIEFKLERSTDRKTLLATPPEPRAKSAKKGESAEERRARKAVTAPQKAGKRSAGVEPKRSTRKRSR
ncbi:MAG: RNB domain-containing ribonuclease, partial [Burkholderiaceae bacterium]